MITLNFETQRFLGRIIAIGVLVILLAFVSTGCGSQDAARTSTLEGPKAVAAFLRAFAPYRKRAAIEADRPLITLQAAQARCRAYPRHPVPALRRELGLGLYDLSSIRQEAALAKPYVAFVARVEALHLSPPALRAVVRANAIVGREAQRIVGAKVDMCGFLMQWRRHRWSKEFERRYMNAPFGRRRALDESRIAHARKIAVAAVPGLRRLGASFAQASEISSSASF